VVLPYPWVEGEVHEVTLVTSTGLTFSKEIEVATQTPRADWRYISTFALLGLYAGVVPVFIGLLWFPFLSRLPDRWVQFFISLTVGLLIFLGVDAMEEALEVSRDVPSAFQGVGLITLGFLGSVLGITAIGNLLQNRRGDGLPNPLVVAYLIALGIGLHNLGEGLAIGSAYAIGEIALGTFLVVGFTLHNTTEGLGIIAPVATARPPLRHLAFLGLLAGAPTIAGAWIGGFSYSPLSSTLFLAIGAGAIFQVVYVLGRFIMRETESRLITSWNLAGLALGLVIMYGTALLVVA
jgi:zinc transporter ZupT